jgi:hypothetical protein
MSTPGKVLVVLVLLLAPVWIIMISAVAQLNKNAGEQVESLKKNVNALENQVSAAEKEIVGLRDKIALEQEAMADHLAMIRAHKSDLEKSRSEWIENVTRYRFDLASRQETAKRAEATRDLRLAEKMQETEAKKATEAEVEQLKQEHAQLVEQLDKLRSDFKATLESNQKGVERLKGKKAS